MNLPVAREGLPFILVFLAAAVLAAIWARSGGWGARTALPAGLVMLTLFVVYFFRDPERRIPADPDVVVSPADGTVMSVREVAGEAAGDGVHGGDGDPRHDLPEHLQRARAAGAARRPGGRVRLPAGAVSARLAR